MKKTINSERFEYITTRYTNLTKEELKEFSPFFNCLTRVPENYLIDYRIRLKYKECYKTGKHNQTLFQLINTTKYNCQTDITFYEKFVTLQRQITMLEQQTINANVVKEIYIKQKLKEADKELFQYVSSSKKKEKTSLLNEVNYQNKKYVKNIIK